MPYNLYLSENPDQGCTQGVISIRFSRERIKGCTAFLNKYEFGFTQLKLVGFRYLSGSTKQRKSLAVNSKSAKN